IGDVHHLENPVASDLQVAAKEILPGIGAEIPNVGKIVDRGSAGIHADLPFYDRPERFLATGVGVVKADQKAVPAVGAPGQRPSGASEEPAFGVSPPAPGTVNAGHPFRHGSRRRAGSRLVPKKTGGRCSGPRRIESIGGSEVHSDAELE